MASFEERKRRGAEIVKKYKPGAGNDSYAAATDALTDILLAVCENPDEAERMMHAVDMEYRGLLESENIVGEG